MTTFDLTYNPFTKKKKFFVEGEEKCFDECWGTGDKELFEWCGDFFEKLYKKYNDSEMEVNFKGILRDYEFLEDAKDAYEKENPSAKITLKDGGCADTNERLGNLKKLFEKMQSDTPFESLKGKEMKDLFDKVVSSDFEMAVVATMSSGKSTLINAMLGRELLPARNEATTATLAKIHDEDGADHFKGKSYDKDGNELASCDPLRLENMDELNDNPKTSVIEIHGDIVGIESKDLQLVLTDTPGPNNSRTDEHREHTYSLLKAEYKPMILYVLNGTQLETNDDNSLLNEVTKEMNSGGRQAQERFIFVLNKADEFDPDKGEDVLKKVADVKAYLEKHNIHDARVFPVAARMAKIIRQYQNKQPLTEMEEDELQLKRKWFIKSEWRHFSSFAPLSPAAKKAQDAMLASVKGNSDAYQEALIYTGVPAVELAVSEYLTKYALPAKITEGVRSFEKKIENLGIEAAETEKLKGNQAEVEKLSGALQAIDAVLQKGEKADEVRKKIDGLSVEKMLQEKFASLSSSIFNEIRTKTQNMRNEEMPKRTAEGNLDTLKKILAELESKFRVDMKNTLNGILKQQAEEFIEEYKQYLESLVGSVSYKIQMSAIIGDLATISVTETLSKYSQTKTVQKLNANKKWYKPWTWGQPKYISVKQEVVNFSNYLDNEVKPVFYENFSKSEQAAFKYAKEEEQRLKAAFQEQFTKLNNVIKQKVDEKKKNLENKETLEKMIQQNQRNLTWLKDFTHKLDSLLAI